MLKIMVGALLGVTVALLFAPKSGKELREDLSDHANDARKRGRSMARNVSRRARELGDQVQEQLG